MQTNLQSQQKQIPFNFLVQVQLKVSAVHALQRITLHPLLAKLFEQNWEKALISITKI